VILSSIEDIYSTFVQHVADGRGMTWEAVDSIGQGRVWAGSDALRIGLVDEIGGMEEAINEAILLAGLETWSIKEYPEQKDPFQEIFDELTGSTRIEAKIKSELGDNYRLYQYMKYWQNTTGAQMRMPFDVYIN
jgi:protease-4